MYNPAFKISSDILKHITQIESAKAVIENSPIVPLYERKFQADATVRKVHFSTAIEGNYLQIDEVRKILSQSSTNESLSLTTDEEGHQVIARKRDFHEVINYRDVIKYIEDIVHQRKELTEKVIKDIHKILLRSILDKKGGVYRKDKAVTINYATGEKLYPYEDPGNIEGKVRELIKWYNSEAVKTESPILKAGLLHLELVRIHPFEEANGRLARALATLSLSMDGYGVRHFFCLDEYYDSDAKDYYHYLSEGFSNPTKWLEYFSLGMAVEFNRVKERVLKMSKDAKIRERTGGQVFITERQEKVIEWLNNYGYFRNKDFDVLFPDISDDTVLRELKGLIDASVVVKRGKTKSARYELAG